MNGEGEERKEIEARLHFAGITRSRLARRLIMSFARDSQVQPTSVLTIYLTCLARPSSCKPLPPPSHNGIRSLSDAPGLWTSRGLGREVHGPSRLFLVSNAVRCEGLYTTGLPGAGKHAPGATAPYVKHSN
jgi:hypothetical protein